MKTTTVLANVIVLFAALAVAAPEMVCGSASTDVETTQNG